MSNDLPKVMQKIRASNPGLSVVTAPALNYKGNMARVRFLTHTGHRTVLLSYFPLLGGRAGGWLVPSWAKLHSNFRRRALERWMFHEK